MSLWPGYAHRRATVAVVARHPFCQRKIDMSEFAGLELEVEKPFRMVLVHPVTRQPLRDETGAEAYIDHYSSDSDVARKHQRSVQRRRLAMRGRAKITPEELEAESIELLAALTTGWNLVDLKGKKLNVEFSQETARRLYANPGIGWLRDQLDESTADRANFAKGSSTS
ncbi:hypothetical protein [Bradyrhizobium sp. USDA 4545]|uniref:hypothetical protein n=1 Tax=Bradyrhizobium sp. USDA 4545 TaxID=2817705 RepID=UPI0020A3719D|nr:hypothetical protein [Bradyrhizobium sp. USDA 4545]MCP1832836.1 hypothetical protein [Bradyrhizobium sp. USDA 4545]